MDISLPNELGKRKNDVIDLTSGSHSKDETESLESNQSSKRVRSGLNSGRKWQPFYLMYSDHIASLEHKRNCLSLTDLFHAESNNPIDEVLLLDYLFDLNFIMEELPMLCDGSIPVLLLHGDKNVHSAWREHGAENEQSLLYAALSRPFFSWRFVNVKLTKEQFGTHHTKMCVIFFKNGVRICIHTANLLAGDKNAMTQGMFVQDFPLKQQKYTRSSAMHTTVIDSCEFEDALCDYFEHYTSNNGNVSKIVTKKYFVDYIINTIPSDFIVFNKVTKDFWY